MQVWWRSARCIQSGSCEQSATTRRTYWTQPTFGFGHTSSVFFFFFLCFFQKSWLDWKKPPSQVSSLFSLLTRPHLMVYQCILEKFSWCWLQFYWSVLVLGTSSRPLSTGEKQRWLQDRVRGHRDGRPCQGERMTRSSESRGGLRWRIVDYYYYCYYHFLKTEPYGEWWGGGLGQGSKGRPMQVSVNKYGFGFGFGTHRIRWWFIVSYITSVLRRL